MARRLPFLLALLLIPLAAAAHGQRIEVRSIERSVLLDEATQLDVSLVIGDAVVEATDGDRIEATMELTCADDADLADCRQRAERLLLETRRRGSRLIVKLRRTPRGYLHGIDARLVVRAPRRLHLEVDTRSGDVEVRGMAGDLEIDAISGDVSVVYQRSVAGSVKLDTGIGSADLWLGSERIKGSGWPRKVRWQGSGYGQINIDAGHGDIDVRLE